MPQPADAPPVPGRAEQVAPGIRRILCDNPSPFTYLGTNSYILGSGGGVAVVDPGPVNDAHLRALLGALAPGEHVSHILITHLHSDHSPLARPLAEATGAPVLAYGGPAAGQSPVMQALALQGGLGGGEGTDAGFVPDATIADGEVIAGDGWRVEAIWTPGHHNTHLAFDVDTGDGFGTVLCGDHVMGWSTSIVSPPDGDLTQFMESCDRLLSRPAGLYLPGHGPELTAPHDRLRWLVDHRLAREASILAALASGPADAATLARRVYTDTPQHLLPAATRNVLAHLIDLSGKTRVTQDGRLTADSVFRLT